MVATLVRRLWFFIRDITPGTLLEDLLQGPMEALYDLLRSFGL